MYKLSFLLALVAMVLTAPGCDDAASSSGNDKEVLGEVSEDGDSLEETGEPDLVDTPDLQGDQEEVSDRDLSVEETIDGETDQESDLSDGSDTDLQEPDTADVEEDEIEELGQPGEPCDSVAPCAADLVCAAGVCTTPEGPCTSDSDCQGDTYCCTDGCEPMGLCIPYGEGPRGDQDDTCQVEIVPGLFDAAVQCEWSGPPEGDAFPGHVQVLTTPLVADLPNDSGAASEIVVVSYNYTDGGSAAAAGSNPAYFGVIRILNGQTCEQLESIDDPANRVIASSPPAIADLDLDGDLEIVTQRAVSGLIAFTWDDVEQRYVTYWVATETNFSGSNRWDGPAIHDLDDDGYPEIITGSEVYDGRTGARLNTGQVISGASAGTLSVVADVDADGAIELLATGVWQWDTATNMWVSDWPAVPGARHYGYADFGTETSDGFDPTVLDGIAEVVLAGNGSLSLYTLNGQLLLQSTGISGGGPPTIGDFDNDGFPEIASAGGTAYRVFDLDCATGTEAGCTAANIRWIQPSQDSSSATTGSSIFDFEADGKAEAVYADECFTRIYDGATGEVLFSSFRTSCTWYENAIIADPDQDQNTEILVGSNANCSISCPAVDPIHPGLRCENGSQCPSGLCSDDLCRCSDDSQCIDGTSCQPPITGAAALGNTCRAVHPPGVGLTGLRVMRDRLDRWASSRAMWNQHVYSVTNILDDGRVPQTSAWEPNFSSAELNNFRQNQQGAIPANYTPDITGSFDGDQICEYFNEEIHLVATVCNRGARAVGAAMPATFYLGDPADNVQLCTSYTQGPVPVGECMEVTCIVDSEVTGLVTMVTNDDGSGGQTTLECNDDNNTDSISVVNCTVN